MSTFILGSDDASDLARFAEEVAPAVREAVAAERPSDPSPEHLKEGSDLRLVHRTPDARRRRTASVRTRCWTSPPGRPDRIPTPIGTTSRAELAAAQHLIDIHDHLRGELHQIRDLVAQVTEGSVDVGGARQQINAMALRSNRWTVGAHCAGYCYLLTTHHTLEDQAMFPGLRQADSRLGPVLDRLAEEHR